MIRHLRGSIQTVAMLNRTSNCSSYHSRQHETLERTGQTIDVDTGTADHETGKPDCSLSPWKTVFGVNGLCFTISVLPKKQVATISDRLLLHIEK